MENFEYDRTFPLECEDIENDPDDAEELRGSLYSYERDLRNDPRFVLPLAPSIFEKLVASCELIAKEFGGRIKAKIDYSFYTATIELWLCYVEFNRGEFMSILHQISHCASSVHMTPLTNGDLHIEISIPYFVSAKDLVETD